MSFLEELKGFIEYCNEFYNINYGLYPVATTEEIESAVGYYLMNPHTWDVQFDSLDREKVREILGDYRIV